MASASSGGAALLTSANTWTNTQTFRAATTFTGATTFSSLTVASATISTALPASASISGDLGTGHSTETNITSFTVPNACLVLITVRGENSSGVHVANFVVRVNGATPTTGTQLCTGNSSTNVAATICTAVYAASAGDIIYFNGYQSGGATHVIIDSTSSVLQAQYIVYGGIGQPGFTLGALWFPPLNVGNTGGSIRVMTNGGGASVGGVLVITDGVNANANVTSSGALTPSIVQAFPLAKGEHLHYIECDQTFTTDVALGIALVNVGVLELSPAS